MFFIQSELLQPLLKKNYSVGSPLFLRSAYYQSMKTKEQNQRQRSLDDLEIDGGNPPEDDFSESAQFYSRV